MISRVRLRVRATISYLTRPNVVFLPPHHLHSTLPSSKIIKLAPVFIENKYLQTCIAHVREKHAFMNVIDIREEWNIERENADNREYYDKRIVIQR